MVTWRPLGKTKSNSLVKRKWPSKVARPVPGRDALASMAEAGGDLKGREETGEHASAPPQMGHDRSRPVDRMKTFLGWLVALLLGALLIWAHWPASALPLDQPVDRIAIEKSARRLTLLYHDAVVRQYSVALGRNPAGPKEREGDRKTPEGIYHIVEHKRPSGFHLALRLSYPEERDRARARSLGASPGSDIMIHGIKNGLGFIGRMHRCFDWTAGCIAVTNPEIEEIGRLVADGTVVEIRP